MVGSDGLDLILSRRGVWTADAVTSLALRGLRINKAIANVAYRHPICLVS
jgi:hypothetical protein